MPCVQRRRNMSQAWRGICGAWETVNKGMKWIIRDGLSTRFWLDPWLEGGLKLPDVATGPIPPSEIAASIKHYVGKNDLWM